MPLPPRRKPAPWALASTIRAGWLAARVYWSVGVRSEVCTGFAFPPAVGGAVAAAAPDLDASATPSSPASVHPAGTVFTAYEARPKRDLHSTWWLRMYHPGGGV